MAREIARTSPRALRACIVGVPGCASASPSTPQFHRVRLHWEAPNVGHVALYRVQRKRGPATSANAFVQIGTSTSQIFIDPEELPNGVEFTYRVAAEFDDVTPHEVSPPSKPVTITAVNNAPVAA